MKLNGDWGGEAGYVFYTTFKIGSPDLTKIETLDDVDMFGRSQDWQLRVDGYHRVSGVPAGK